MKGRFECGSRKLARAAILIAAALSMPGLNASLRAQSATPDWEKAAGGKQEFDVASVRQDTAEGRPYSNFSLDNGNAWFTVSKQDALAPNGTLFSAKNQTLLHFIVFAYKLSGAQELALRFDFYAGFGLHVPEWVRNDRYDIDARTPKPASKDQMRLMMQSLLAERFKLAVHWETREVPVFALVLATTGQAGAATRSASGERRLRQHRASREFGEGSGSNAGDGAVFGAADSVRHDRAFAGGRREGRALWRTQCDADHAGAVDADADRVSYAAAAAYR